MKILVINKLFDKRRAIAVTNGCIGLAAASLLMDGFNPIIEFYRYYFITEPCSYQQQYCEKNTLRTEFYKYFSIWIFIQVPVMSIFTLKISRNSLRFLALFLFNSPVVVFLILQEFKLWRVYEECTAIKNGIPSCRDVLGVDWMTLIYIGGSVYLLSPVLIWVGEVIYRSVPEQNR